jgi:hypothetical protein
LNVRHCEEKKYVGNEIFGMEAIIELNVRALKPIERLPMKLERRFSRAMSKEILTEGKVKARYMLVFFYHYIKLIIEYHKSKEIKRFNCLL